jgi:hypothetical protein
MWVTILVVAWQNVQLQVAAGTTVMDITHQDVHLHLLQVNVQLEAMVVAVTAVVLSTVLLQGLSNRHSNSHSALSHHLLLRPSLQDPAAVAVVDLAAAVVVQAAEEEGINLKMI